ncbi:hypothetical protein DD752_00865, partial [Helicobacter pylori]
MLAFHFFSGFQTTGFLILFCALAKELFVTHLNTDPIHGTTHGFNINFQYKPLNNVQFIKKIFFISADPHL